MEASKESYLLIEELIARPVFQKGTSPLRSGVEIALYVGGQGPYTLIRDGSKTLLLESKPSKPDLSVFLSPKSLELLHKNSHQDVGALGVHLLQLMASEKPEEKIKTKVHIGILAFVSHGYLGILPLGGKPVMSFLASKGVTGIGKIKTIISNLRD